MSAAPPLMTVAAALGAAAAGGALGRGYFALLRRSVEGLSSGASRFAPLALTAARLVGAAAFFAVLGRLGALPLLASLIGFLAARGWALRACPRSP
ncbi:MAG TPA: ATP synthase subunit I [Steroidobacteraceae bacterium]|nr:ATP synthase subunit I [Steroidobacteraceae bacterium]